MPSTTDPDCLFCKIVDGQIPAAIVFQTDQVTAFRDINPQLPTHVLVVPNEHIANTEALSPEHDQLVGAVVRAAREVAAREGLSERGYRAVINTGPDANNSVAHLHLHVVGGRPMTWPPG
ncbi:MAG TPA: histidine triad nucleotide-binding protein [Chloroflexota bacterium]|nr:histidine triad nucleotide-binding protein [Chloroflexota bacterium]